MRNVFQLASTLLCITWLISVSSVEADWALILWVEHWFTEVKNGVNMRAPVVVGFQRMQAFPKYEACDGRTNTQTCWDAKDGRHCYRFECFPDTVDPRK